MKSASRFTLLCAVLALGSLALTGCSSGPKHPDLPNTVEHARTLEAKEPTKAHEEFQGAAIKLADQNKKEEAAKALLEGIQFAADPTRYGTPAQFNAENESSMSPELRQEMEVKRAEGETAAHEDIKTLLDQYKETKAAEEARKLGLREDLEKRIDKRNSQQFSYKLVAGLVKMTGEIPAFSYWFALALIAFIVKGITLPLSLKMYKSQREMQRLQPALKALNEKYKGNTTELQQKTMEFYKEHKVNPFASCLPMLIQMPFMIWVYNTIRLYEFHFVNGKFLWIGSPLAHNFPGYVAENMGKFDFPLLVLYTASMYLTMKLTPASDPQQQQQQQSMSLMTTGMMFFMFMKYQWSAAFIFYWLILNILSAWQSYHFVYKPNKKKAGEAEPVLVMDHGHIVEKSSSAGGTLAAEGPPSPGGSATRRPRRKRR